MKIETENTVQNGTLIFLDESFYFSHRFNCKEGLSPKVVQMFSDFEISIPTF